MAGAMAPIIVAFAGALSMFAAGDALPSEDDWSWSGDASSATMLTQPVQRQALLGEEAFQVSELQSWGVEEADTEPNVQVGQQTETASFSIVCERTRKALYTTVPDSPSPNKLLGGPVYGECTSALASERHGSVGGDAVSVLHDCMALVDALVSRLSSSKTASTNVCSDLAASLHVLPSQPATPKAASVSAVREHSSVQPPALPKPDAHVGDALIPKTAPMSQGALRAETMQVGLVAEHMKDICIETVQTVEAGIKAETDALELSNVTAACEGVAQKSLGSLVALPGTMTQALHGWCSELDGRLMLALEAGFLFALQPDDAQRQAGRTNPYSMATRRQFCDRFAASVQHNSLQSSHSSEVASSAQANAVHMAGTQQPHIAVLPAVTPHPPVTATPKQLPQRVVKVQPQQVPTTGNLRGSEDKGRSVVPASAEPAHAGVAPAAAAYPAKTLVAQSTQAASSASPPIVELHAKVPQVASGSTGGHKAKDAAASKAGSGMEMFRLVQTLSAKPDWSSACVDLLVGLAAKEGSVTDVDALKKPAVESGVAVLTFNGADQSTIGGCATRLEGIAGKAGILSMLSMTKSDTGDDDTAAKKIQQAYVKSPWAFDACSDIAHAFLTMELANPGTKPPQFCQLYTKTLQRMKGASNNADVEHSQAARNDVARLKQRARERAMRGMSHAMATKVQSHKPDAILAVVKPVVKPAESNVAPSLPVDTGAPAQVPRSADSAAAVAEPAPLAGDGTPVQAASSDAGNHEGQVSSSKTPVPTNDAETGSASDNASTGTAASDSGAASDPTKQDDEVAAAFWRGQMEG